MKVRCGVGWESFPHRFRSLQAQTGPPHPHRLLARVWRTIEHEARRGPLGACSRPPGPFPASVRVCRLCGHGSDSVDRWPLCAASIGAAARRLGLGRSRSPLQFLLGVGADTRSVWFLLGRLFTEALAPWRGGPGGVAKLSSAGGFDARPSAVRGVPSVGLATRRIGTAARTRRTCPSSPSP